MSKFDRYVLTLLQILFFSCLLNLLPFCFGVQTLFYTFWWIALFCGVSRSHGNWKVLKLTLSKGWRNYWRKEQLQIFIKRVRCFFFGLGSIHSFVIWIKIKWLSITAVSILGLINLVIQFKLLCFWFLLSTCSIFYDLHH
jgi:hypothetical protein